MAQTNMESCRLTIAANGVCPLSVIIPTYNRSDMVQACVRSVLECGQAGVQVVVVDDGSTDDTEEKVCAMGDNVVYLRQQNQGPAAARNLGFRHSAGRYVAFLDDDDQWLPDVPGRIVGLMDRHLEADAVFADARIVWPEHIYCTQADLPLSWLKYVGAGEPLSGLPHHVPEPRFAVFDRVPFFRRMTERNQVFISAVILRREAFERAGMFDPGLRGAADWELWLRIASRMTFACWPEPLAEYMRHDACMSFDSEHMQKEFWMALKQCREKCAHLGPAEKALVQKRLRSSLFSYAYGMYDRGDYRQARVRFALLMHECGFEASGALFWLFCALPFGLTAAVRRLKQACARGR